MKIYAICGSARKESNTATLLREALKGAADKGADTELIFLYDLCYQGCSSCFSCKKLGDPSYGQCATRDELTPVLDKLKEADAILFGSPVYAGSITGEMQSFLERLCYPYSRYNPERSSLYGRRIKTVFIYTMNAAKERMEASGWNGQFINTQNVLDKILGPNRTLYSHNTTQFDDYSLYDSSAFDPAEKARIRREEFPAQLKQAYDLGVWCTEPLE